MVCATAASYVSDCEFENNKKEIFLDPYFSFMQAWSFLDQLTEIFAQVKWCYSQPVGFFLVLDVSWLHLGYNKVTFGLYAFSFSQFLQFINFFKIHNLPIVPISYTSGV